MPKAKRVLATNTSLREITLHVLAFEAGSQLWGVPFGVEGVDGLEVHFPLNCNMFASTVPETRSSLGGW